MPGRVPPCPRTPHLDQSGAVNRNGPKGTCRAYGRRVVSSVFSRGKAVVVGAHIDLPSRRRGVFERLERRNPTLLPSSRRLSSRKHLRRGITSCEEASRWEGKENWQISTVGALSRNPQQSSVRRWGDAPTGDAQRCKMPSR